MAGTQRHQRRGSSRPGWGSLLAAAAALALAVASAATSPANAASDGHPAGGGRAGLHSAGAGSQPQRLGTVATNKTRAGERAPRASLAAVAQDAAPSPASCVNVSIAPGDSPGGGYLPLSLFGIAPISGVGDDSITNFNVPAFSYNGISYTRLGVSSNGYLQVGGGTTTTFINTAFPSPDDLDGLLAPFWTDLNPGIGGALRVGTLTDGVDTWIVVDWEAVREFSAPRLNSFEVWIGIEGDANPGEDVTYAYGTIEGNGDGGFLTVGAENNTGTAGQMAYYNGVGTLPTLGTQLRVTTGGGRPIADFTATPTAGASPLHVDFDGTASRDDGSVASYAWDFGDGATATGATTSHDYAAGSYTASLTVTDNDGGTCTATRTVVASGPFSINDVSVNESAGTATFTVSREGGTEAASVDVEAVAGTASTPDDFSFATTTVDFAPGETSRTVDVAIVQDAVDENLETYTLNLTRPVGGAIADGSGLGTIVDDDPPVQISVSDATVVEPDSGTRNLRFKVNLSGASGRTVTVRAVTADGSAQAPSDYYAKSVKLTFQPGQITKTVYVAVRGDWRREPNETLFLLLTRPTNATLADPSGTGGIINDD